MLDGRISRGCCLLACLLCQAAFAQDDDEQDRVRNFLEEEHAVSMAFETPHTKWAKPFAGGMVRAVFIAPWFQGSTEGREIVELAQRFDIEPQAIYLQGERLVGDGRPDWYGNDPEAGTKRALRLLGGPADVVFMNQVSLEKLSAPVRARLLERVRGGLGLVLVGSTFQETSAPVPKPESWEALQVDAGRVAVLPAREKLSYGLGWEVTLDYQLQEQGRALLWAAQREPAGRIGIELKAARLERGELPANVGTISWKDLPAETQLAVSVRRGDGVRMALIAQTAHEDGSVDVFLPVLRESAYHLDVFATGQKGVENWRTAPFEIVSERQVDHVELKKDWAEVGDVIEGTVRLSGPVGRKEDVMVRLVDVHGRVLDEVKARPRDAAASFRFHVAAWMPMLLRVEAALMDGKDEVSAAHTFARVVKRGRDQFNFVMWNMASGDLAPYGAEGLARAGVTSILQGGPPPLYQAASNLTYAPYAASFRSSSHTLTAMLDPETGLLKSGCVHDPAKMAETLKQVVDGAKKAREHGVFAYSLGDENAVRASCLSPQCLQANREYLKEVYGTIAALNAEWGSDYTDFDAISLLEEGDLPAPDAPAWFQEFFGEWDLLHRTDNEGAKDEALNRQVRFGAVNDEMRALQQGNFARWYDRQAFQCQTYIEWCKQFQRAFREIDPQAWTGFEGTDSFTLRKLTTRSRQGGDLDAFVRELDYYGSYEGPGNEVMRSIAPNGFPMGSWIGYTPDRDELLQKYWQQVCDRMNTVQWWRWDNLDGYHGYLTPSLTPFPATQELLDDTRIVRDGLGTLLMHCEMEDDGIAMLYSMPSTHIAHFDQNDTYGLYKRDHDRWHMLLHDAGLQFRYVTDRMMRLGEFDPKRYKVLLLPLAFAMSSEEARVICDFVEQGGTVIADVRPALYDGHCKPLAKGQLDDLFGITRSGNRAARELDRLYVDGEINGRKVAMRWGNWHGKDVYPAMKTDPSVTLGTGNALGKASPIHYWTGLDVPVCVVNEVGKGRAILLNFSVFDAPMEKLLPDLLAAAGVEPAIRLKTPEGRKPKGIEISRWRNGNIALVALLGAYEGEVSIEGMAQPHVFDLKQHAPAGATTMLRPHRASFFAAMPEPAATPVLRMRGQARRGGVATLEVRVPGASGTHAVTLRVTQPDGTEAAWLEQTILVGAKAAAVALPLALNDPDGAWTVRATDLFGAERAELRVNVR